MKQHKNIRLLSAVMAAGLLFAGCSNDQVDDFFKKIVQAPPSSIERDVKGHEQIYAVHAILRMGYKGGMIGVGPDGNDSVQAYNTYHLVSSATSIPVMQEIDIAKDDDGQMTITTERDCFDVIASDDIYYGLELKYYDQNGMLINHQFSGYPFTKDKEGINIPDEDNATLLVHQHFFGIGNASLNKEVADSTSAGHGQQVKNQVPFDADLAWKAIEVSGKPEALQPYTVGGKTYRLFKTIDPMELNKITPEIFTYEYRDTDPVEEELGKLFTEAYNDDFTDPDTEAPRQRYGHTVGFLRQKRSLDVGSDMDRLGFKGMMQFHRSDIAFQLQVRICHIMNKGQQHAGESEKPAKYCNTNNSEHGFLWDFNQLQPGWDSFDIDYPLSVRVIANTKDGEDKCFEDVKRFYPAADKAQLWRMLTQPRDFFIQYRQNVVLM